MEAVVLVIHLMLAVALIALVMIQRSEGGGLGIGGGGLGQLAGVRATANVLTRATAVCAAGFFVTSLVLAFMAGAHSNRDGILESYPAEAGAVAGAEGDVPSDAVPAEPPSVPISE